MKPIRFTILYARALAVAAIAFSIAHSTELFVISLISMPTTKIDPTAFITLGFVSVTECIVFIAIGGPIAYFPSRLVFYFIRKRQKTSSIVCAYSSICIAILALPICAAVSRLIALDSDGPSYFNRCLEYSLPMVIAGAIGGHVFWQSLRRETASKRPVADVFS